MIGSTATLIAVSALLMGVADQFATAPNSDAAVGGAELVRVVEAQLVVRVAGRPPAEKTISLPFRWDSEQPGDSGIAELSFEFPRPPVNSTAPFSTAPFSTAPFSTAPRPYALFISYLGNAYEIELNGALLAAFGELNVPGHQTAAKQPVVLNFPASLLLDTNHVTVRLRCDSRRRGGMSAVVVGPLHLVEPITDRAYRTRVLPTQAAAIISLLVSGFCFLLWLQQRDAFYAWASIGEAIWALVVADTVFDLSFFPWPAWSYFVFQLRALWVWALYMIATGVFATRPRYERVGMLSAVVLASICIVLSLATDSAAPIDYWRMMMAVVWMLIIILFANSARLNPTSERIVMVTGLTAILIAGWHDARIATLSASMYDEQSWVRYFGSLIALIIMWIASKRFRNARAEVLQLNASLTQRIDRKEGELRESFQKLSEVERSRAVVAERERILRDMHDGVGANLATAMRQLESGTAPTSQVADTLRESLDHLKLSIDAMNLPTGDVNALLASLRYRLQPRIESAGLTLEWQVDPLPHWQRGSDQAMRHLQFLLLEAISNALQHANASTLSLSANVKETQIEIGLRDNGKGFTDAPGRGLQSMRERARAIGAQLTIEGAKPGTLVSITLAAS